METTLTIAQHSYLKTLLTFMGEFYKSDCTDRGF